MHGILRSMIDDDEFLVSFKVEICFCNSISHCAIYWNHFAIWWTMVEYVVFAGAVLSTIIMHVCKRALHTWMHNYSVVHFNRWVTKAYCICKTNNVELLLLLSSLCCWWRQNSLIFTCINSTNNSIDSNRFDSISGLLPHLFSFWINKLNNL